MWIPIVVLVIALLILIVTWTKNVKPGDKPINIAVSIIAVLMILISVYFIFI